MRWKRFDGKTVCTWKIDVLIWFNDNTFVKRKLGDKINQMMKSMVNDTVMVIVQRQNLKIQFQFFNDVIDGDEYFQFGFFVPGISWARDEIHTQNDKHEIGIVIRCKIIIEKNVAKDEIVLKIKYLIWWGAFFYSFRFLFHHFKFHHNNYICNFHSRVGHDITTSTRAITTWRNFNLASENQNWNLATRIMTDSLKQKVRSQCVWPSSNTQ